jgi:hypothetical protein
VVAISDQFVEDGRDNGKGFGVVESNTAGETALGEGAKLADDQLVELLLLSDVTVGVACGIWADLSGRQLHLVVLAVFQWPMAMDAVR